MAILSLVACLMLLTCNSRNPNLSEKQLLALANDTVSKTEEIPAFEFPDTSYVPAAGAKYSEIRSVDPASPPVTLKVSVSQGVKQPLKLSRFGSSVEYVVLRLPDENDFFSLSPSPGVGTYFIRGGTLGNRSILQVNRLGNHFVVSDAIGVRLFDSSGKFVQNLLLSEFEGGEQNVQKVSIGWDGYRQAILSDISGTRCLLTFVDYEGMKNPIDFIVKGGYGQGKIWAGEFDLSKQPLYVPQNEIPSLTPGVEMVPVRSVPSGLFLNDNTRFSFIRTGNPVAISFNSMGDTLCRFTNYVEGNGGAYNSDRAFFYRADGELFFRHEYCDTIYRVQSANRIVPVYCFDFGEKRLLPSEDAIGKSLGKLVPYKWIVFKNEMMLIFSEGRDCPICRTRNEVTFYCLLFDKKTGQATAIDMRSRYPENILIENDLDNGLPVPLNTLHVQEETIIATFAKEQIQEMLKNNVDNYSPETVTKLKALAETLKQNEMLVIIIK